ncbi:MULTISPECIES: hypothetical protein [unclassified Bradyrhizobium]|uniref:hypothetical protein n=1 Tax=unclassified Bradyrhizobium TaxID=2631580 RepID=UPI002FF29501
MADGKVIATVENGDIVIRIPRLAIPYIAADTAAELGGDTVIFVGDIGGLRDEIVAGINDARIAETMVGGVIVGLIKRGTKHAAAVKLPVDVAVYSLQTVEMAKSGET